MSVQGSWRYVVPSLITCASIGLAFCGIAEAIAGRHESAAWLMLLCVLLDKADGTVARLLKSSTRFGIELDSLSDLIAFGVAPAVLGLAVLTRHPERPAEPFAGYHHMVYVACMLYVMASALRLAKFNVRTEEYGPRHFFGIPTTLCGGLICSYLLTVWKYQLSPVFVQLLPALMVLFAVLMVSRIPLRKPRLFGNLPGNIFFVVNLVCILLFGILRLFPEYLFTVGTGYVVIGGTWATAAGVRPPAPGGSGEPG
jgi:CDP-diacylglycerol--serine O-phosphatidyltransferase